MKWEDRLLLWASLVGAGLQFLWACMMPDVEHAAPLFFYGFMILLLGGIWQQVYDRNKSRCQ